MKYFRVKQAADYLGVTPQTIRNWSNNGELQHSYSGAGQRLYTLKDLDDYKNKRLGITPEPEISKNVFYTRTSNKQDVSLQNQYDKLEQAYGSPDSYFKDTGSGLNENRKGLKQLLSYIQQTDDHVIVYITNKDRLSRFGYSYLEELYKAYDAEIIVLDNDDTKEPLEVLMQDFMSLLASFSGKFYRLRGWKQQQKFLKDVEQEVVKHV